MRFMLCFLTLSLGAVPARASLPAAGSQWWCTISAQVAGNPTHFFEYGRDSWAGETTMRCRRNGEERVQTVQVAFSSKNSGFGANQSSILTFNITLWTQQDPQVLSLDITAPALVNGSIVYWNLNAEGSEVNASAWTGSESGVAHSLSMGTLTITSLLFRDY